MVTNQTTETDHKPPPANGDTRLEWERIQTRAGAMMIRLSGNVRVVVSGGPPWSVAVEVVESPASGHTRGRADPMHSVRSLERRVVLAGFRTKLEAMRAGGCYVRGWRDHNATTPGGAK